MEDMLFEIEKEPAVFNSKDETVWREAHRIMELLRFTPDADGVFTARCAPDNYVLPALKGYFTARFHDLPWTIIDEKRGKCLRCLQKGKAEIIDWEPPAERVAVEIEENSRVKNINNEKTVSDEWEELWKHYHKTINNEDRHNPKLQRQLMPQRYWKYLPEKEEQ